MMAHEYGRAPVPGASGPRALRPVMSPVAGDDELERCLEELARHWPVGARVRHARSGWTGVVVADVGEEPPGITDGAGSAYCLLFPPPYARRVPGLVCVRWDDPQAAGVAWMRPSWLRRLDGGGRGISAVAHGPRRRRVRQGAPA